MKSISVQDVSKEFVLSGARPRYRNLKDFLITSAPSAVPPRLFRALDGISFDAEPGEVLGIIGRNGAGKSTLLKILSRIIRPSRGRVEVRGRVGSLLEVGAGFHPELTGRENIFLNGAILGMNHAEIAGKLDAIVAFAGVETHLDEPVKHYSSGMYMRLAFAVAAHIEPEILLIDEVLAVGDAEFQKKSVERIEQVGRRGQTVVLVSHDIQTVLRLCQRAVCLDRGRVVEIGPSATVAARYLEIGGANHGERRYADGPFAPGDSVVRLRGVRVCHRDGETLPTADIGREIGLEIEFEVLTSSVLFPSISLHNETAAVLWVTDASGEWHGRERPPGRYRETAWLPPHLLSPGALRATVAIRSFRPQTEHFVEPDAVVFHAVETAGGARGQYPAHIAAAVRPLVRWTTHR
jgi:lipopolysaccharide transport system ATP-binding protein